MADKNLQKTVAKKLELLANHQKLVKLLNKEGDKVGEYKLGQKESKEIAKIKAKLKK
jgi:hypothetical protein